MVFTFIVLGVVFLLWVGNQPTRDCRLEGQKFYDDLKVKNKRLLHDVAKEHDWYCDGQSFNRNFYNDGSLKNDPHTGHHFKKGQYYADSRGNAADHSSNHGYRSAPKH